MTVTLVARAGVLLARERGGVCGDGGVLDGPLTEDGDPLGEGVVDERAALELTPGLRDGGLVGQYPGVQRPADRPEMLQCRDRTAPPETPSRPMVRSSNSSNPQ